MLLLKFCRPPFSLPVIQFHLPPSLRPFLQFCLPLSACMSSLAHSAASITAFSTVLATTPPVLFAPVLTACYILGFCLPFSSVLLFPTYCTCTTASHHLHFIFYCKRIFSVSQTDTERNFTCFVVSWNGMKQNFAYFFSVRETCKNLAK